MRVIVSVLTFDNVEDNQYPDIDQKEEVLNNFLAGINFWPYRKSSSEPMRMVARATSCK